MINIQDFQYFLHFYTSLYNHVHSLGEFLITSTNFRNVYFLTMTRAMFRRWLEMCFSLGLFACARFLQLVYSLPKVYTILILLWRKSVPHKTYHVSPIVTSKPIHFISPHPKSWGILKELTHHQSIVDRASCAIVLVFFSISSHLYVQIILAHCPSHITSLVKVSNIKGHDVSENTIKTLKFFLEYIKEICLVILKRKNVHITHRLTLTHDILKLIVTLRVSDGLVKQWYCLQEFACIAITRILRACR